MVRLAGRALRLLLEAHVEPDRRVEGGELVDEDRLQLGLEGVGLLAGGEVAAGAAPGADRVGDARDHVLDAPLALRRAHAAPEVLLRDDVRGRLRPELRELDALLLEDRLVLAGDERVALLPLDLLERVAPGDREVALDAEARGLVDDDVSRLLGAGFGGLNLSRGRHADPPEKVIRGRPTCRRGPGKVKGGPDDTGDRLAAPYRRSRGVGAGAVAGTMRRAWMRRATKLPPAAARSRKAIPASTSNGSGTESAFEGPSLSISLEISPFGGLPLLSFPNAIGPAACRPELLDGPSLCLSRSSIARRISSDASA